MQKTVMTMTGKSISKTKTYTLQSIRWLCLNQLFKKE